MQRIIIKSNKAPLKNGALPWNPIKIPITKKLRKAHPKIDNMLYDINNNEVELFQQPHGRNAVELFTTTKGELI